MATEIVVSGLREFSGGLKADITKSDVAARNIVVKGSIALADTAKQQFRATPSGSRRTSKLSGRVYWMGAPQFPANPPNPTNRSGTLRRSIRPARSPISLGAGRWMSYAGANVVYAPYVEFGTSRARKFPYMKNALIDTADVIALLAEREWAAAQI